jgi:hypothetical protein
LDPERLKALLKALGSSVFAGHRGLHRPRPPSTSPEEPGFHPRSYWRGPAWPVINWLLWWSLLRAEKLEWAEQLRRTALLQLAEGGFGEVLRALQPPVFGLHRAVLERRRCPRLAGERVTTRGKGSSVAPDTFIVRWREVADKDLATADPAFWLREVDYLRRGIREGA